MESPTDNAEVIRGGEATNKRIVRTILDAKQHYDVMVSSSGPPFVMRSEDIREAMRETSKRGVHIRYLTDITRENLEYCKGIAAMAEVRHIEGIKGRIAINEGEIISSSIVLDKDPVPHLFWSNVRDVVEQHNYIFESFWVQALPADQRFDEIEYGREPEFLRQIHDPKQAISVLHDVASSVKHEGLLILPKGLARSQEQRLRGFLDLLADTAKDNKAELRIIGPSIQKSLMKHSEIAEWLLQNIQAHTIKFREGNESNQLLLVADGCRFVRTELRTGEKSFYSSFENTVGFTAYSNSQPAVASFRSLFEMIWRHLEVNDKLKEVARSREEFVSVAAHELRSPITPILLMADLLKKGKAMDESSLRIVTRSAEKLDRLIRDVLEVSRVDSGTLNLEKELMDLSGIASQLVLDARSELEQDGRGEKIRLVFDTSAADNPQRKILVDADKGRIAEVISNLLSNAIKFTEIGTIAISVGIIDAQAVVSVRDEGKGIDPQIMSRLFTKYATKSHMGTGLGLYVSKNIVESHGGKIWAENNSDGKGATFSFRLPLAGPVATSSA